MHLHNIPALELPATTTRADWLEQRRHGIGSSDASALFGLSSWESPYSLWEIKTGKAPLDPPVDDRTKELREWGNRLEPVILDAVSERLGIPLVKPDVGYCHYDRHWQRANLDGWDGQSARPAELKTADSSQRNLWLGQIADHAEIQVHHTASVTGADHAIVAALVGGNSLYVHEIQINPRIVEMVLETEDRFWNYHVMRDIPPPIDGHIRTLETLTREWAHKPGSREVAVHEVEDAWREALDAADTRKQAELAENRAKARLAQLLAGHDQLTTGKRVWARVQRGQMNLTKLSADHPDIVDKYIRKPAFDLESFKAENPDLYRKYQSVSVRPIKEKN